MDDVLAPPWVEDPWWLDTVHEDDLLEPAEGWETAAAAGGLSVAETVLAARLAGPGGEAITLLASLTDRVLTDEQRLTVVELWQPQLAWVAGAEQAAIALFAGPEPAAADQLDPDSHDFHAFELAVALDCTREHAERRIWQARLLSGPLSLTGDLLRAGALDPYRVWVLLETLTTLPIDLARQVEAELLPGAAAMSGPRLRRAARKAARRVNPDWSAQEFAKKRTTRRVAFHPEAEIGLTLLYAYLPPADAVAVETHLRKTAALPSPDPQDPRSTDERMADALVAAVLGSIPGDPTTPQAPKVQIQVLMSLPTLLGLREDTAELCGYGEIPPDVARELAGDAEFRRWVYAPVTGHLLDQGDADYRPKAKLRRFIHARDRYCQFPGSSRSAARADLDHIQEFKQGEGGHTCADNLAALSRSAHQAKTHGGHDLTRNDDGSLTWTTPLGRQRTTGPHDYRPDSER